MITVIMFIGLSIIAAILFLYMLGDLEHRIYGNIAAGIISCFLIWFLAISVANGNVITGDYSRDVINETVYNSTDLNITSITTYEYGEPAKAHVVDEGLGWVYGIAALIFTIYTAYLGLEAFYRKEGVM